MNRKVTLGAAPLCAALVALAGCGASGSTGNTAGSSSAAPIKIVLVPPASGPLAQYGADAVQGWRLAAKQANDAGGVDGRKVDLIMKDTDGQLGTTVRAVTEGVTKDGAQFIGGVMTSPENVAVFKTAQSLNVLAFNHIGQENSLTGANCSSNGFNIVQTVNMNVAAMNTLLKQFPGKKWALMGADFSTGHDASAAFTAAAKASGSEVVSDQFAPLGTQDFGSYISKIKDSGADALFTTVYGADAAAFIKQASQFNLASQIGVMAGLSSVTEPLFPVIGDAAVGFYGNVQYSVAADNKLNKSFVEAYKKEYGKDPYYFPANAYIAAETLFAGVKKAGSTDAHKVAAALEGLKVDTIDGELTLRPQDHQLLMPVFIGQVEHAGSGLAWKISNEVDAATTSPQPNPACHL
jgi:branched-chain amino acid transport system substrate-binding protein